MLPERLSYYRRAATHPPPHSPSSSAPHSPWGNSGGNSGTQLRATPGRQLRDSTLKHQIQRASPHLGKARNTARSKPVIPFIRVKLPFCSAVLAMSHESCYYQNNLVQPIPLGCALTRFSENSNPFEVRFANLIPRKTGDTPGTAEIMPRMISAGVSPVFAPPMGLLDSLTSRLLDSSTSELLTPSSQLLLPAHHKTFRFFISHPLRHLPHFSPLALHAHLPH
jgi:hypothetical protein